MPTEFRIAKKISIEGLGLPTPSFVRDGQNRVTQITFTYQSIEVTVDATWLGTTSDIDTFIQAVADL